MTHDQNQKINNPVGVKQGNLLVVCQLVPAGFFIFCRYKNIDNLCWHLL